MNVGDRRVFWDTNVWVYLFDRDSPEKQDRVRRLLKQDHGRIITSTQVLQEFYVVVTQKLERPLDPETASQALSGLSEFCTASVDVQTVLSAALLSRERSLSFWDALIVEAAARGGASVLLTEDLQDGQTIRNVQVLDPFADA